MTYRLLKIRKLPETDDLEVEMEKTWDEMEKRKNVSLPHCKTINLVIQ